MTARKRHLTPTFLIKNRYGTYYFRFIVPKTFSGYENKRIEIKRSLKTNLRSLAIERARRLLVATEALIHEFQMKETDEHPIEWLKKTIDKLIEHDELERQRRQEFFENLFSEAMKRLEPPYEIIQADTPAPKKRGRLSKPTLSGLPATRITDVIEKYCLENKLHWRPKTEHENRFLLKLFADVLDDKQIGTLTLEDARAYKEAVLKIPKNRSKLPQYRTLSVKELLEIDIPMNERMNARNAQKYLSRAKTFLKWAQLNGFIREDIGGVLTYKLPERSKKRRLPFSTIDLRKIVQSQEYKEDLHHRDYQFWLPLLGMFTGARLNELCQLHVEDILHRSGIRVIYIRDGENRRVKNVSSIRYVPIHSKLVELGFVEFWKSQKRAGHKRLFPELKEHRDGYGGSASKWFSNYLKRCGVKCSDPEKELKTFHSFRHTVTTNLANSTADGIYERVINAILGHEKGKSESMKTYTHNISPKALQAAIEEIKYRIDFSHLKDNRYLTSSV